jgi:hypothetical protein
MAVWIRSISKCASATGLKPCPMPPPSAGFLFAMDEACEGQAHCLGMTKLVSVPKKRAALAARGCYKIA